MCLIGMLGLGADTYALWTARGTALLGCNRNRWAALKKSIQVVWEFQSHNVPKDIQFVVS